jgi:hypothetical protein
VKRQPGTDWWPVPLKPGEPSKPNSPEELDELERDLKRAIDYEKCDGSAANNRSYHAFHPKGPPNPGMDIIELFECANSVSVTYRPEFVRSKVMRGSREMLHVAEQVICNMPGGDMILIKDRYRPTPVYLMHGERPWQEVIRIGKGSLARRQAMRKVWKP